VGVGQAGLPVISTRQLLAASPLAPGGAGRDRPRKPNSARISGHHTLKRNVVSPQAVGLRPFVPWLGTTPDNDAPEGTHVIHTMLRM
jgi:hypothetical protein